jgi:hypothetical protein
MANINIPPAETPIGIEPMSFEITAPIVARTAIPAIIHGTFLIILPLLSDIADVVRNILVAWTTHQKYGVKQIDWYFLYNIFSIHLPAKQAIM